MEVTVRRKRPWLVHAIVNCVNCTWEEDNYTTAVEEARKHAQKTGHTVLVETGYAQIYNDK